MRSLIFSIAGFAAVVIALSIWWVGRDVDSERAKIEDRRNEAAAKIGIRKMFSENSAYIISDFALGVRSEGGLRDFRGFLQRDGKALPAYGRLRSVCVEGFERPECWEIAYLEANGNPLVDQASSLTPPPATESPVDPATATPAEPATEAGAGSQATALPETSTAADPATTPPPPSDASTGQPAEASPEAAPAESETVPTHVVVPSLANARAGPDKNASVIAVLPKGTALVLQESNGSWGRFQVVDGNLAGKTVWIALSIVAKNEPQ